MEARRHQRRSHRGKSVRWIAASIVLCSGMSCIAPVLYASTDCSRWLAEYKQGIMQRKAAKRLRAAKFRLTAMVHKPAPVHVLPTRHRMSPLESLRRFQIDCGDLDVPPPTPLNAAVVPPFPPLPVEPRFSLVSFGDTVPALPPPGDALVAESTVPPLINVPTTPILDLPAPTLTPEPDTFLLVLTGVGAFVYAARRKDLRNEQDSVTAA